MPRLISSARFNQKLRKASYNINEGKKFLIEGTASYAVPNLSLPAGYRLLKSIKNHYGKNGEEQIKIRLMCGEHIVYAVNLNIVSNVINHKSCTQVLVWRTFKREHDHVLAGFANKMFDHFLDRYIVIVSDTEQTQDGRRFWDNRITNMINAAEFVYFTDMNDLDDDLVNNIHQIDSEEEFLNKWMDHGWGEGEEYKDRLFVISKESLL
jgi:hypothetical protein